MKLRFLLFMTGILVSNQGLALSYILKPGQQAGFIGAKSSEASLQKKIGVDQVKPTPISIGEGEEVPGTIVFPGDPLREIRIIWKDDQAKANPKEVIIRGEKSNWKTKQGIGLGTSLKEIEKLNKGPIHLSGFGWDYSGTVLDGASGKLKFLGADREQRGIEGRTLILRLEPKSQTQSVSEKEYQSVLGDEFFRSDNPVMQKLDPQVYEMVMSIND